jgi:hypothetical protein
MKSRVPYKVVVVKTVEEHFYVPSARSPEEATEVALSGDIEPTYIDVEVLDAFAEETEPEDESDVDPEC